MTAPALAAVLERVCAVLPAAAVRVGIEAAGHYHRPLLAAAVWPAGWQVLELSPARVAEQRRVQGRRRVKTDAIDLEAITELVLARPRVPVTARAAAATELTGWAAHRQRRVQTRTALRRASVEFQADRFRRYPGEVLVVRLRPGNSNANHAGDHIAVLGEAIGQITPPYLRRLLVRADTASATHQLLNWLSEQNQVRGGGPRENTGVVEITDLLDLGK